MPFAPTLSTMYSNALHINSTTAGTGRTKDVLFSQIFITRLFIYLNLYSISVSSVVMGEIILCVVTTSRLIYSCWDVLNENDSHRLIYLNVWSLLGGNTLERLGKVTLVKLL